MNPLLAIWERSVTAWNWIDILIFIVVIAACVGIVYVALEVFGVAIPAWVIRIFWIVVAACVAILAIRFVASL